MKFSKAMVAILGIPKTLYFNFYYLPFKEAIKFPLIILPGLKIANMGSRGSLKIEKPGSRIIIGRKGSFALSSGRKTYWEISNTATVVFNGNAAFGKGTQLIVCGGAY